MVLSAATSVPAMVEQLLRLGAELLAVCVVDTCDDAVISVIPAVEESDGRDSSMVRRPIASNERHNLGHYCL